MRIKHTLNAIGKCPIDGARDSYKIVVKTKTTIPVEHILDTIARLLKDGPLFQEDFTRALSKKLGAQIKTVCYHTGVKTVCIE